MPWLQATVAGWIAGAGRCGYDHVGELPHRVYDNLRGGDPAQLVQIWEDSDGLAGIGICLRFGSAFDLFAAPALRDGPAAERMVLAAAATTARLAAPGEEHVLTDVFDCDTARIALLERLGFERFRVWDDATEREIGDDLPPVVVPDGFVVRPARLSDADGLAEARNASFGSDWTGAQYRAGMMQRPGYDPNREILVEAPDGRIAAFTVAWVDGLNRIGHFEPVGTHADFRRLGLARAAMAYALHGMREQGITRATVNYNAENLPAGRLYAGLGFTKEHETYGYRRPRSF